MIDQVIREIDGLIDLFESRAVPARLNDPKNLKLQDKFRKDIEKYFQSLSNAFPYHKLAEIYYQYVKEARTKLPSGQEDWLDPEIQIFTAELLNIMITWAAAAYISASTQMIDWGKTKAGIPISYEGPPMQSAIKWAEQHCAKLVTKMDEETKSRLAKVIIDGIENKRGVEGLARDIRNTFDNMSKYRSKLIAQTETGHVLRQASLDSMKDMGVTGKEWVLGSGGVEGNCDACLANAAVGVIPVDQEFPTPEADIHPGCTCAIAPSMM